jgi:hypothetical protein
MDAWNDRYFYVRVIKTGDGSLVFLWNVALLTGVTSDYVKVSAALFQSTVDDASDFKP